jgi:cytochrome b6-f complex iron-sulfur subunit
MGETHLENQSVDPGRRRFVNVLLGGVGVGWLASMIYPVVRYLIPPKSAEANPSTLKVAKEADVAPNSAVMFKYGRKPGLLIRTPEGKFVALSAVCTHLDCTVQFKASEGVIWCACHNGRYDLTGRNISGPPPRPLTPFEVNILNGEVYVTQKES